MPDKLDLAPDFWRKRAEEATDRLEGDRTITSLTAVR
jgi:hypothetical protein